ncbi:helix-turn-helix transcriptional regulator [Actinomycetes bacterium KLBMP 9797]
MARDPVVVSFRARVLGRLMRQLRDENGLTIKHVAAYVGVDFALLGRFERGEWSMPRHQVAILLDVYRVHDRDEQERLFRLAEAVWRSRSEMDFDGAVPDESFADLLWLESEATTIHCYAPSGLPDLLHASGYADLVARAVLGERAIQEQVDARVALAARRQQVLRRPDPVRLEVVLDECVLRHPVCDQRVWAEQLDHLAAVSQMTNVQVRILPAGVARPPHVCGGYCVFALSQPYPALVAHVEYLGGRLLMENGAATAHLQAFDRLREAALAPGASAGLVLSCQDTTFPTADVLRERLI